MLRPLAVWFLSFLCCCAASDHEPIDLDVWWLTEGQGDDLLKGLEDLPSNQLDLITHRTVIPLGDWRRGKADVVFVWAEACNMPEIRDRFRARAGDQLRTHTSYRLVTVERGPADK